MTHANANTEAPTTGVQRRRRVVHLPVYNDNPYQAILMECQKHFGWDTIDGGGGGNFFRSVAQRWRPDILHLHWLHPYLLRQNKLASWMRGLRFVAEIAAIRKMGTRIVWTVHNLSNHARQHVAIEDFLTRRVARHCDLIIAHGEVALLAAREKYRVPNSVPMMSVRHPNYCDQFPLSLSRAEARAFMGYSHLDFVIGHVGRLEPYKQVVELVAAVRELNIPDLRLFIRGKAAPDYALKIQEAIGDDSRIDFQSGYIATEDVGNLVTCADVVACPSRGILTSGSVLLAMSLGRPVIAPAEGCIPEEVGTTGVLYNSSTPNHLQQAILKSISLRRQLPEMGRLALENAYEAHPQKIAGQIVAAYDNLR